MRCWNAQYLAPQRLWDRNVAAKRSLPILLGAGRVFVFSAGTAAWEAAQGAFPFLPTE